MLLVSLKIRFEIRNRVAIRILIIYAKTSTYIDDFDVYFFILQPILNLVDSFCERDEIVHLKNLATNMEMQAAEFHIGQALGKNDEFFHILHGYAELILGQSCCDIRMSMCTYIWIDAEANICGFVFGCSQFVKYQQFWNALHIEAEDVVVESEIDFPIALTHTRKYNFISWKTYFKHSLYFATTHAVYSQSCIQYQFEYFGIDICLHSIVYVIIIVLIYFSTDSIKCLFQ